MLHTSGMYALDTPINEEMYLDGLIMSVVFDETTDNRNLPGCVLLYNKKAASWKKARKKYKHWFSSSIHFPVQKVSEDWLKARLPERLVVMGGDGTVHSVANAILLGGMDIPVGVIPGGGGNDFFKRLIHQGDPIGPHGFTDHAVLAVEYTDNATQRYAIEFLEWGIGAMVAARRENGEGTFLNGMLKYFYLAIKSLFTFNSWKATIRLDGKDMEFDNLSSVVVGFGSSSLGGGHILFPDECEGPNRNSPFVMIAEGFSRFKGLGLLFKIIRKKQYTDPLVMYYPFRSLELIPCSQESSMLTIDGELYPAPPVKISLSDKKLKTFYAH
ncbi:MAG: diacylglycerol kinase family protein [ANME-2 cluster archaeon]|nr:diacylglycerol kinase family protein [ANME-2 cluster archaeon]